MAGDWKETTIGAEVTLQRGFDITKLIQRPGHIPVVSTAGVLSFHDTAMSRGPGVILGRKGNGIGRAHYVDKDFWPHDTTLWVKDFKGNDPQFVFYFFAQMFDRLQSMDVGSANPTLNRNHVHPIRTRWPPVAQQRSIAAVLGTLDDKIELNRRMNATLEAMARALFQSWFVDFDPVRAKLDGRQPAGLDAVTAALFPAVFQQSPLGPIPLGWNICALSKKIQLLNGGTPKTSEPTYWNGDIPWYSLKDAPAETDIWVIHTDKAVTRLGIANSAAQIFPERTTIISARGTVGKLALTAVPMAMNQSCYGVRGSSGYGDYFTYYSLRQATAQLQQRTHGTVFDTITTRTFETLDCIFPTPELAAAFDKQVDPLLTQIRANLYQSRTLATLRNSLLPKLLSGELHVARPSEATVSVNSARKRANAKR